MATASIQFALDRGERQLWAGAPRQGVVLRPADMYLIPFTLLWAGFAIFWEASVVRDGAPLFMVLWGIPFVVVGLYIVGGRFWIDARRRARTTYALTSERLLISSGRRAPAMKSLDLRTVSDITLRERRDGSGTITFGPTHPLAALYAGAAWPGVAQPPSFEMIPSARRVYELIREAQRASARSAG
jgi:hypothetical protein